MDILDIVLARNSSFSASTAKLVQQANAAMAKANAVADMADDVQAAYDEVEQLNAEATAVAENLNQMQSDVTSAAEELIQEQAVTNVNVTDETTSSAAIKHLNVEKNNETTTYDFINYTSSGTNTDGSMTQKAITDELAKLEEKINAGGGSGGGGSTNLGKDNAGKIVVVGDNGNITAGTLTEKEIADAMEGGLTPTPDPETSNTLGLDVNYATKSFTRTGDAVHLQPGSTFDRFTMYGGRKRCNVSDNGTITAFYGDSNYADDGSNGQVMIYQPKFYYKRTPYNTEDGVVGKIVREDGFLISDVKQSGYRLHPLFVNENGEELEYVLLSAYEGGFYDVSKNEYATDDNSNTAFAADLLSSVAEVKPISGVNKALTLSNAEQLAKNRGDGWHITNMAAESATQMLYMIEYGSLNGQQTLERGCCDLTRITGANFANQTGSTAGLGNSTGAAESTINITNGTTTTYTSSGYRAISYRGMENPWGNIWRYIGGTLINGSGSQNGGVLYICDNYEYADNVNASNYHSVGFAIANTSSWISALGYGSTNYDWVLAPAECSGANAVTPVGDFSWSISNLNGTNIVSIGGTASHGANDGLFYYAFDRAPSGYSYGQSARLMFIPHLSDSNYQSNIAAWNQAMGA